MATPIKYHELKDIQWVYSQLLVMSPKQLSKIVGCPLSSINWIRDRYFTQDMKSNVTYIRKNKKRV